MPATPAPAIFLTVEVACQGDCNVVHLRGKLVSGVCSFLYNKVHALIPSSKRIILDLTDLELATAARACRALAYKERQAAKKMENPTTRGPIENTAKRAAALAERFERARKKR